jgi:glycosyltransferase involved in cell wall biosynthesis
MKICIVAHDFIPTSGGGKYPFMLANALVERGFQVGIFWAQNKHKEIKTDFFNSGIYQSIYRYKNNSNMSRVNTPDPIFVSQCDELISAFCEFLDNFKPDICHFMHFEQQSLFFVEECKKREIKTVMTFLDSYLFCIKFTPLKRFGDALVPCDCPNVEECANCFLDWYDIGWFVRFDEFLSFHAMVKLFLGTRLEITKNILEHIDRFISPSTHLATAHTNFLGIKKDKIAVIKHGIEKVENTIAMQKSDKRVIFGFVGGMLDTKGYKDLVMAFNMLGVDNVVLKIWGPKAPRSISCNIEYCGMFGHDELSAIMAEIDVYVHPSYYENAPLSIREALSYAKPIISYSNSGAAEILSDNQNAILVDIGNIEALKDAMERMLRQDIRKFFEDGAISTSVALFDEEVADVCAQYDELMTQSNTVDACRFISMRPFAAGLAEYLRHEPLFQGVTNEFFEDSYIDRYILSKENEDTYVSPILFKKISDEKLKSAVWSKLLDKNGMDATVDDVAIAFTDMADKLSDIKCRFLQLHGIEIYGAGDAGKRCFGGCRYFNLQVDAFIDDNKSGSWCDLPIKSSTSILPSSDIVFSCASAAALNSFMSKAKKIECKNSFWYVEVSALASVLGVDVAIQICELLVWCEIYNAQRSGVAIYDTLFLSHIYLGEFVFALLGRNYVEHGDFDSMNIKAMLDDCGRVNPNIKSKVSFVLSILF